MRSLLGPIAAILAAAAAPASARDKAELLIRHATVIDVASGRTVPDQAIAIAGDTIRAVGPDRAVSRRSPRGARSMRPANSSCRACGTCTCISAVVPT